MSFWFGFIFKMAPLCCAFLIFLPPVYASSKQQEVPVESFTGLNSDFVFGEQALILAWLIRPFNATIFWLRCFRGYPVDDKRLFWAYDHRLRIYAPTGKLGSRTNQHLIVSDNNLCFKLTILNPTHQDVGFYTCELDAAGTPQRRNESVHVIGYNETEKLWRRKANQSAPVSLAEKPPATNRNNSQECENNTLVIFTAPAVVVVFAVAVLGAVVLRVLGSFVLLKKRCTHAERIEDKPTLEVKSTLLQVPETMV